MTKSVHSPQSIVHSRTKLFSLWTVDRGPWTQFNVRGMHAL